MSRTVATTSKRVPFARTPRPVRWTPPLAPGTLKAYDHALKYLRADSHALKRDIRRLKHDHFATAAAAARTGRSHDPDALARYRSKFHVLQVQSEINLPEVRCAFNTGRFPFVKPVYRHLTEHKWRNGGTLDLLMERLHQMHVIPDLLPALHPTLDLRIHFPTPAPRSARQLPRFTSVEPGAFLLPEQTRHPPRVSATVFHTDTRLYTLLMLDPDVPDEPSRSFQTYLHWMQPNIALSAARRITHIPIPAPAPAPTDVPHLPYVPPHPQRGTPYHRYVLLLLPHPAPLAAAAAPAARSPFDLRAFLAHARIDPARGGGGAHMWRAVWDAAVSRIYSDTLARPEPRYGRPAAPDRYAQRAAL